MAKFVVSRDGQLVGHFFIDKDRFSLGRHPANDLQLDDPAVSNQHAVIITLGNDQILEDLQSTNGTRVNGKPIAKKTILLNNDQLEIGPYRLDYLSQRAARNMDFDKTLVAASESWGDEPPPQAHVAQLSTAVGAARKASERFARGEVQGLKGRYAGRKIKLDRVLRTFGTPGVQLAVIMRRPHGYFIGHVEGRKPTRVNGRPIGSDLQPLRDYDLIEIGTEQLRFLKL